MSARGPSRPICQPVKCATPVSVIEHQASRKTTRGVLVVVATPAPLSSRSLYLCLPALFLDDLLLRITACCMNAYMMWSRAGVLLAQHHRHHLLFPSPLRAPACTRRVSPGLKGKMYGGHQARTSQRGVRQTSRQAELDRLSTILQPIVQFLDSSLGTGSHSVPLPPPPMLSLGSAMLRSRRVLVTACLVVLVLSFGSTLLIRTRGADEDGTLLPWSDHISGQWSQLTDIAAGTLGGWRSGGEEGGGVAPEWQRDVARWKGVMERQERQFGKRVLQVRARSAR